MSCPYSEEELQKWDGVSNPMGKPCQSCYQCDCEHWGDCPDDCDEEDRQKHDCRKWQEELEPVPA